MALDLKCPSCDCDNTQRLSVMWDQQSVVGTIGNGQTFLAASLKAPLKPWALTVGFIIALCTIPIFSALPSGLESLVFLLGFPLVWLGIRYWMNQNYEAKYQKWKDNLDENFICLRCGDIFDPPSDSGDRWSGLNIEKAMARNNSATGGLPTP